MSDQPITFCGMTERFGDGTPLYKLQNQRPMFYVESCPPQFTKAKFIELMMDAFGYWSLVADVLFVPTNDVNAAQFRIFTKKFDGASGILADCMMPAPGMRQQDMRFDPDERWSDADNPPNGMISIRAVGCHEMGHGLGSPHFDPSPPPELMEPRYTPGIYRPQETEAAFMAKLYGKPVEAAPPAAPGTPADFLNVDLILTHPVTNAKYRAKGKAPRIIS